MKVRRRWTAAEESDLLEYERRNYSIALIAGILDRSERSIACKLDKIRAKRRGVTRVRGRELASYSDHSLVVECRRRGFTVTRRRPEPDLPPGGVHLL